MIGGFQNATGSLSRQSRAFTLLELLVVMTVIGVLTATILPALTKAKQRGIQIHCMSNLKQVGIAMQLFVNDNNDVLPGPVWSGAMASYDKTSNNELIWYIADYLDSQTPETVPVGKPVVAEVFVCPGYFRYAPGVTSMKGRKCYLLNDNLTTAEDAERVRPFGYPELEDPPTPLVPPLKFSDLESYCSPSTTYALVDVDRANVRDPTVSWQVDLPDKPVHGRVRNKLYFDWHVSADQVNY